MMGPGHAFSGMAAGLGAALLANTLGTPVSPAAAFTAAGLCAGAALLPDLDHPSATVSRSLGPLTELLAHGLNAISGGVYRATRSRRDDDRDGGHRGLTHTWVFAAGVGGALTGAVALWGKPVVLGALFFLLSLALRGLAKDWARGQGWIGVSLAAGLLTWLTAGALPEADAGAWLGAVVALGCLVHCWGDSLTLSGCPWLWPVPIAGQRWYPIGTPSALRFRAGGAAETWLVMPVLTLGTLALAALTFPPVQSAVSALVG